MFKINKIETIWCCFGDVDSQIYCIFGAKNKIIPVMNKLNSF